MHKGTIKVSARALKSSTEEAFGEKARDGEERDHQVTNKRDPQAKLPDFVILSNSTPINSRSSRDNLASWVCFGSALELTIPTVGLVTN